MSSTALEIIPLASNQALAFMKIGDEYRIDSRIIATGIGIEHRALIQTLRKHQDRLERLGVFTFEMSKPPKGTEGGRPETYVLLNKNQAAFAITLSRNTEQVVGFKFDLIEAFDLLVHGQHEPPVPQSILDFDGVLEQLEQLQDRVERLEAAQTGEALLRIPMAYNRLPLLHEQEKAQVLRIVRHHWQVYGTGVTASRLAGCFVKRLSTSHAQRLLEELAAEGRLEQYVTCHTALYGGKFKPMGA